ncbi:hypothetical protein AWB75_05357 [Caballeronia catudaia]|uniref:Uncharacterized protein n=1 Tax=Caballeronia catudaia TaxID=1777136 RepID=A0A158CLJ7_9BURK|nr:hypothetical protein [Caballeronia catudaia]SAK83140.1 hypothetical protein AWB75_05357 [Caballeronia catudaia]
MKRVFLIVVLLIGSSSLFAAERYSEVWNPPEAQAVKGKSKPHASTQAAAKKKRKSATPVKQVADKAAMQQPSTSARPKASSRKQAEPVIPRKIEPNGQVMRV